MKSKYDEQQNTNPASGESDQTIYKPLHQMTIMLLKFYSI